MLKLLVDGENVIPEVHEVKKKIENFTNSVVNGELIKGLQVKQ